MLFASNHAMRFFGERVFGRFLDVVEKDPEKRLQKALDLALKAILKAERREGILNLKEILRTDRNLQRLAT